MRTWTLAFGLLVASFASVTAAGQPAAPRGVHYVYLVRHGVYDRDTTVTDDRLGNGLNALGHEQAKLVGARLAQLPVRLHALVSSDFARARETADDIGALVGLVPVRDSLIQECTPPSDRPDLMEDAGELARCDSTLKAAWAKYFTPSPEADRHDVLVCHGNVIRWMTSRALGLDLTRWTRMDIGNGSLTILAVRPDGSARLVMYSDVGHLPLDKQTWAGAGAGWKAKQVAR
jgi:serine/threonine-protein phosphatase PGAM5